MGIRNVDTRTKIVPPAEASRLAASGVTVVSGYFDPLLAAHADRLHELKHAGTPLLVAIADPPHAILPARARAELVASLAVVDYVAESLDGLAAQTHLETEDARRLEDLIAHVHARQRATA
jgi:glycerol-3-phosphate cytidylyltransferase-like family protein